VVGLILWGRGAVEVVIEPKGRVCLHGCGAGKAINRWIIGMEDGHMVRNGRQGTL